MKGVFQACVCVTIVAGVCGQTGANASSDLDRICDSNPAPIGVRDDAGSRSLLASALESAEQMEAPIAKRICLRLALSDVLRNAGDLVSAERALGLENPALTSAPGALKAMVLIEAGVIRVNQSRFQEAEQALLRAIDLSRAENGLSQSTALLGMSRLADVYSIQGRYREAEGMLTRVVDGFRQSSDTAGLATALRSLAFLRVAEGQVDSAEAAARECLDIDTRLNRGDLPIADDTMVLANILVSKGEPERAYPLARKAAKTYLEHEDKALVAVWRLLGILELGDGKAALAEGHFRDAIRREQELFGTGTTAMAMIRVDLAAALARQHKPAKAQEEIDGALAAERQRLGESHPELARGLMIAAEIAAAAKQYDAADSDYRRALEIYATAAYTSSLFAPARAEYALFLKRAKRLH